MKKYTPIAAFALAFALTSTLGYKWLNAKSGPTDKELYEAIARGVETERLTAKDLQSKWIKSLNESNPELHDAIIAAMLISKDANVEIYLHRNIGENKKFKYTISDKRGDAENILSYNYKTDFFTFDHYSIDDGFTMQMVENREIINRKINKYYEELGVK